MRIRIDLDARVDSDYGVLMREFWAEAARRGILELRVGAVALEITPVRVEGIPTPYRDDRRGFIELVRVQRVEERRGR